MNRFSRFHRFSRARNFSRASNAAHPNGLALGRGTALGPRSDGGVLPCIVLVGLLAATMPASAADPNQTAGTPGGAVEDAGGAADGNPAGDTARKAEIMSSPRWRRAIFELGEWLSTQPIYTPDQVRRIKSDFNRRVAGMSSFELEYLLDELDAKFKILDTPEAQDARAWVGQYLSTMSDQRRSQALRDVPDVVNMSANQLQQELVAIERRRAELQQSQAGFQAGREAMVQRAQSAQQATARAAAAPRSSGGGASFSPYRSHGGSKPFENVDTGPGISMGIGPGGMAFFGFSHVL
jgi:hypothetical protein